jgi:hypothetical protein
MFERSPPVVFEDAIWSAHRTPRHTAALPHVSSQPR